MTTSELQNLLLTTLASLREKEGMAIPEDVVPDIHVPADPAHGDYATNVCLQLAKIVHLPPRDLAAKLVEALKNTEVVQSDATFSAIEVAGPGFVNFTLSARALSAYANTILAAGLSYGRSTSGAGKRMLLDFFGANTAKPLHIGHLRSLMIGHALYNLFATQGYELVTDPHYGDWGVQFGILLNAFLRLSEGEREAVLTAPDGVDQLNALYIEENARIETDPAVREAGKATFAKLEQGDAELHGYWQRFVEASAKTYPSVLDWLGLPAFTAELGEAFYSDKMDREVKEALQHGAIQEEKAVFFDLEDVQLGRCYLVKSDGSTTYHLRDVATMRYRQETWNPARNIYIVAKDQDHHFRQLFEVCRRMGMSLASRSEHVSFGVMRLPEGKLSTRKGTIIRATELFAETEQRIAAVIAEKNPDLVQREQVAHQIAVGVLKWWDLSHDHRTDVIFDWDTALSFEGNTGPYMQYTVARLGSILHKAGDTTFGTQLPETAVFPHPSEQLLLHKLVPYTDSVQWATDEREPHLLCTYLFELAQLANKLYAEVPVLSEPDLPLRTARLTLIATVRTVLAGGLTLLGIPVVEEM